MKLAIGIITTLLLTSGYWFAKQEPVYAENSSESAESLPKKITINLQSVLDTAVKEQGIPGAVMYVETSNGVWNGAAGIADLNNRKIMKPSDRFRIASMSKMFVATVVLQLVEEEELSLDDRLTDWLSEEVTDRLPNSDKIKIRQLLNHTSGLDDYFGNDEFEQAVKQAGLHHIWTASEAIQYAYNLEPLSTPGKEHHYSNTNYILLELIVEQVTENSLAQEMRDRIFTPLGLKNTFTEMREKIPGGFVHGYQNDEENGTRRDMTETNFGNGLGDGGLISTASDVGIFVRALFGGAELLAPETLAQMLNFVDDGNGNFYGLGVAASETEWGKALGHNGNANGFASTSWYLVDEDVTVVVLTNDADHATPDDIAENAIGVVLNELEE